MANRIAGDAAEMGGRHGDKVTNDVSGFTRKMALVVLLIVVLGGILAGGFWMFVRTPATRINSENSATRPAEP